jgi:hypothetical protein
LAEIHSGIILAPNLANFILNPGTIICRNSNIYPTSNVRGIIPPNSIYKNENNIIQKNICEENNSTAK